MKNDQSPLLTVVITSYNHANYVKQAILSIIEQKFSDFELLIIDDKSSDNSVEIIKELKDPRLKLIELPKNRGVCYACNLGMQNAKGKYIKIFASDDIALPNLLQKQIDFLESNPAYDAVFSGMEVIDENGKYLPKKTKKFEKFFTNQNRSREEWLNHFFFKGNCLAAPTMMARKELLKKVNYFDSRFSQAHDFDMWVRYCISGSNLFILNEKLVQYRRISNNKNLSSNTKKTRIRLTFDDEKILHNFLDIKDVPSLVKIFPDLQPLESQISVDLIPFFIAQEALKVNSVHHQQFAISLLHDILSSEEMRDILQNKFDFTISRDFYNLVSKSPLGSMLEIINKKPLYRRIIKSIGNIILPKKAS